jgi:acetolactate synthase-1/2/3 large subunit
MRLGEAIIDLLVREYGLRTVFGIPGVHNIELYRGLHRSGVRAISPRHEQGAGFMADGWSVVTGTPGVCTLISGPGLTNALTPIAQAFHDSRPMLVLAATTPTDALGRRFGPLHDLDDQAAVARTVTAFSETVLHPDEVPELIAMAYDVFRSRRPRPVHLAFPTDVLELECGPLSVFPSPATRPVPLPSAVNAAADALQGSSAPVIIAGGGAIDAGDELQRVATTLDAPVVLTGNAKGVLPSSHPLCAGNSLVVPVVQAVLETADAVLVVGSELSDADLFNGGRALEFTGRVVRIDLDAEQIERRVHPDVRIVADATLALRALAGRLRNQDADGAARAASLRAAADASTSEVFAPWVDALQAALPVDAIVALDSTQLAYAAHGRLRAERPRSWLAPYGLGTLGCALPMAIGAKLAMPERPVLALAGDGGWLFTVAEMATAVDESLDMVLVLWDNRGYAQIRQSFDDAAAPRMGVDVSSADPEAIARGFGWHTHTATTPDELRDGVRAAFAAGGPQFVRVVVPS